MNKDKTENTPQEGEFKMKKKKGRPKKLNNGNTTAARIDLSKKETKTEENSKQTKEANNVDVVLEEKKNESVIEEVVEKLEDVKDVVEETSKPIIEEITSEEEVVQPETVNEVKPELPDGVDKLVQFMKETGGNMQDYIRLNADYSNIDDDTLLKEYYKNSKPHLELDEIDFIMEENFKVDEDYDEEREVRRKKLAKKEEVVKAKSFLDGLKNKYYEEIKLRPTVNNELTKAREFFTKFSKDKEVAQKQHEMFKTDTKTYFSDFKGFDFNLGEKKFRYGVNNPGDVADAQSDISNVVKKFLNDKGEVVDVKGYHKAIYTARNADNIAQHFYEQGKADAVKDVVAKSKNISKDARKSAPENIHIKGFKLKAVNGLDSNKLKINKR